jgi:hypothetical protein
LIIENKVRSAEARDQTLFYRRFAQDTQQESKDFLVFLTPDETEFPKDKYFVQITYQQVCDSVLIPCLNHPLLSSENRYLMEQYLSNLSKYDEELEEPMANSNRALCKDIFNKHRDVLLQIFQEVQEVEHLQLARLPGTEPGRKVYETSISDLFNCGVLSPSDTLVVTWKNKQFQASLQYDKDQGVAIIWDGKKYPSPSSAGWAIRQKSTNGWTFWTVVSPDGKKKGTLADLRASISDGALGNTKG